MLSFKRQLMLIYVTRWTKLEVLVFLLGEGNDFRSNNNKQNIWKWEVGFDSRLVAKTESVETHPVTFEIFEAITKS